MKKVLIILNSKYPAAGVLDYLAETNNAEPILLTGVFLPDIDYAKVVVTNLGGLAGPMYLPGYVENSDWLEEGKAFFGHFCIKNNIEFRIHDGVSSPIEDELSKETRFADLLILSADQLNNKTPFEANAEHIEPTAHRAECPVIVIPATYKTPDEIIFAYDGSASSMHALRQFVYLMPLYTSMPITIVEADLTNGDMRDLPYIEEYAARHFTNANFLKLDIEPKKYFSTWLTGKNAIVITGSFGRTAFSEIFKKNFAVTILGQQNLPVFIAHN